MLETYLLSTWHILLELSPWLLLGMAVAGVLHVAIPGRWIQAHLRGPWAPLKAVLVGVPMPLCSCGVIPAGLGLKRDGASNGAALGFLISTPQTGIDSIFVSASFLGWPFALFKVVTAAFTGVAGGLLVDRWPSESESTIAESVQTPTETHGDSTGRGASKQNKLVEMVAHATEVLRSIWGWLVVGVLVSAAIEVFLPTSWMSVVGSWGSLGAALMTLLISLPLYVCATASVPIAAALVASGLPAGAALVFLMAGPATNLATLGAIFRGFGLRVVTLYVSVLVVGSVGFGLLFDWVLPTAVADVAHEMDHVTWWAVAATVVLLALMARFAFEDIGRRLRSRESASESVEVAVAGLHCGSCVARLEGSLSEVAGVTGAVVSLDEQSARVFGSADHRDLRRAVEEAGFELREPSST